MKESNVCMYVCMYGTFTWTLRGRITRHRNNTASAHKACAIIHRVITALFFMSSVVT